MGTKQAICQLGWNPFPDFGKAGESGIHPASGGMATGVAGGWEAVRPGRAVSTTPAEIEWWGGRWAPACTSSAGELKPAVAYLEHTAYP